ncbi:uncharacterized protein OCT59_024380 [Rhizophagus irregularis]|uniref:uncharacterized protein n=1 Tax=Rhizophagus irregularis TaxID=588596 RepID=UPI00332B8B33|nr:hypothetical protein OCT59_024380 [Rhizophagus irregularis]
MDRSVITYDDYSKRGYDGCSQSDQNVLYRSHLIGVQVLLKNDDIPLGQKITNYHRQHNIFEDKQMCMIVKAMNGKLINPNGLDKVSKEETGVGEYWISPVIAIIEIVLNKS